MNKPLTITDWTIESVGETQTFGVKGFQKRLLVITDKTAKYQQFRVIEAIQDKCVDFDGYAKGDKVKIDFWFEGRQHVNKQGVLITYNTDKLASIERMGPDTHPQAFGNYNDTLTHEQKVVAALDAIMPPDNDLPF